METEHPKSRTKVSSQSLGSQGGPGAGLGPAGSLSRLSPPALARPAPWEAAWQTRGPANDRRPRLPAPTPPPAQLAATWRGSLPANRRVLKLALRPARRGRLKWLISVIWLRRPWGWRGGGRSGGPPASSQLSDPGPAAASMAPTLFQKLFNKRSGLGAPGRDARDPDCAFR